MYFGSYTSDLQCKSAAKVQGKLGIRKYFEKKNNAVFYRFLLTITQLKNTENPMIPENCRTLFETIQ